MYRVLKKFSILAFRNFLLEDMFTENTFDFTNHVCVSHKKQIFVQNAAQACAHQTNQNRANISLQF